MMINELIIFSLLVAIFIVLALVAGNTRIRLSKRVEIILIVALIATTLSVLGLMLYILYYGAR